MTYTLKHVIHYIEDYNVLDTGLKTNNIVDHKVVEEYRTESKDTIKQILFDLIGPPVYELTDENIKSNFGMFIEEKFIDQIRNYYSYRKTMYDNIIVWLDSPTYNEDYFHFDIPYEYNHYSCMESACKSDEKQIEFSFTLNIED